MLDLSSIIEYDRFPRWPQGLPEETIISRKGFFVINGVWCNLILGFPEAEAITPRAKGFFVPIHHGVCSIFLVCTTSTWCILTQQNHSKLVTVIVSNWLLHFPDSCLGSSSFWDIFKNLSTWYLKSQFNLGGFSLALVRQVWSLIVYTRKPPCSDGADDDGCLVEENHQSLQWRCYFLNIEWEANFNAFFKLLHTIEQVRP